MGFKVLVANLPGVKEESGGQLRHFVKAGSRWPFTVGLRKEIEYLPIIEKCLNYRWKREISCFEYSRVVQTPSLVTPIFSIKSGGIEN